MIRPRRTFQERNLQSAAKWDRLRTTNRVKGWIRILALLCTFGSLMFFVLARMPSLASTGLKTVSAGSQSNNAIPDNQFHYVLGADEAQEVLPNEHGSSFSQKSDQETFELMENDVSDEDIEEVAPDRDRLPGGSISSDGPNAEKQVADDEPIPKAPPSETLESERTEEGDSEAEVENIEEIESATGKNDPAVISSDGTVGGSDIGGTFDGNAVTIFPQVTLPDQPILQHYDSTQNFWPLHAILKERGWAYATMALPSRVTLWISRGSVPPRLKQGYQMLNSMGVSGCIGGAKSLQLECRRRLARLNGCEYDDLKIQPPQYNMLHVDDCKRFFVDAEKPERENKVYLSKPTYTFHGAGIRVHQGAGGSLRTEFGACKSPKNTILMDYVSNPATMMGGYKFDFRTYLLVASLKPQLVFYHDGFVRKSDRMYDLHSKDLNVHITNKVTQSKDEHFFNFTTLGSELHRELGLPGDHLDTYVRPRAKAVSRFLFQTTLVQPQPPRHVPGRFHLFGIDWLLDANGKLHLLEGNGYPLVTHYHGIDLTPKIWEEMADLILAIQTKPSSMPKKMTVKDDYSFGGWKLVYNELEEVMEQAKGNPYNSCKTFANS